MKMLSGLLALSLGILGAGASIVPAKANEAVRAVTVDTDAFSGTEYLDIVRDHSGAMIAILYSPHDGDPFTWAVDELLRGPQRLKRMNGHDVTFLRLEADFSTIRGGHANLRFLSNGATGTYRNFRIRIDMQGDRPILRSDPNPDDPESDGNAYTSVFNHLFLKKKTFFGQLVGVSEVTPSEL